MSAYVMVRVPVELVERIDRLRGDVPRERWVRRRLEEVVGAPAEASGASAPTSPRVGASRAGAAGTSRESGGAARSPAGLAAPSPKRSDAFKPIPKGAK